MTTPSALPPIDQAPAAAANTVPVVNINMPAVPLEAALDSLSGTSSKDLAIGLGALLVAAVIFFFIRQGYVNWLVSSLKRAPNSASLAGWGLFGALFFGTAIGCIGLISSSLFTLAFVAPLAGLSVLCLVLCIVSSSKR
jgi:hypothetical protein